MTTETEPAHYSHGPSSAHRWLICTDAPYAEAPYPNTTSDPADEGTAAHWLLEQCLKYGQNCQEWVENLAKSQSQAAAYIPAGEETGCVKDWVVTGEMIESVQLAIDEVRKIADKKGTKLFLEERVKLGEQYGLQETVGGTADIIMYTPRSKALYVYDFKYGKGHVVEVDKSSVPGVPFNPQAGIYAIGAMSEAERLLGKGKVVKKIVAGIIQPRAYHKKGPLRTVTIDPFDLMALEGQIIEAVNGPKVRVPGEEQCLFCRAKDDCEAHQVWRAENATAGFEAEPQAVQAAQTPSTAPAPANNIDEVIQLPVKGLSLAQLGSVRAAIPYLKKWIGQVEDEIKVRLEHQLAVPGARLAQGNGKRNYGGTEQERALAASKTAAALGVELDDLYEPAVLKTPAALEKQLGKTAFSKTPLAEYVTRVAGGAIVVDEDSDRADYVDPDTAGFEAEVQNIDDDPLL